jgi:hypothetical protein
MSNSKPPETPEQAADRRHRQLMTNIAILGLILLLCLLQQCSISSKLTDLQTLQAIGR